MTTIKDVAKHAEVSFTTVSHVLNGTRNVSDAVKQRVLKAVQELQYVPSGIARSLKTNRTHTIGIIIPNNSNPFFAEVVRGIEDACFEAGFSAILCNTDDLPAKQQAYARLLGEKQVDGIVGLSSGAEDQLVEVLRGIGVPLVVLDREAGGGDIDQIGIDHEQGTSLAMNHLLLLGHRQIACIAGPLSTGPARLRAQTYQRVLQGADIATPAGFVREADYTSAGGHAATLALLSRPQRPTAIFASNDLMAIGCIAAASSLGLRVPQDLSVVGFDDIALAAYTSPPLTTVAQPKHEAGRLAANLLLERVQGRRTQPRRERLATTLCVRQSTCPPAGGAA